MARTRVGLLCIVLGFLGPRICCGLLLLLSLQMEDGETVAYGNFTNHLIGGLGFESQGNVSMKAGADTKFQGPLNHTGQGRVDMDEGAHALFTGKYSDTDGPDFAKGSAGMVRHNVGGAGMQSAGNISFDLSDTTFSGSLVSDGSTATLKSRNASVNFAAPSTTAAAALAGEGEDFATRRRLLQVQEQREKQPLLQHLVGGLGFESGGNVSITAGADTTFQGSLNHTGSGIIKMTAGARAMFTGAAKGLSLTTPTTPITNRRPGYVANTTQHNTTQHNTTQHNTAQHNTTQHNINDNQEFTFHAECNVHVVKML